MQIVAQEIKKIDDLSIREIISVILSRSIRSCRATTHSDLATLLEPQIKPYYCHKHNKICRPIMTMKSMFSRYAKDTIKRLQEFQKIKMEAHFIVLNGDSREINILESVKKSNPLFGALLSNKKIDGIFSSPPYVGQIDYHEQHAYAYELLEISRNDNKEIGPLYKGQGKEARESYVKGISDVLLNCKDFLKKDYNILLVANDKFNLYPRIAENCGMQIIKQF